MVRTGTKTQRGEGGQQVERDPDGPRQAVLGLPMAPHRVVDEALADPLRCRHAGDPRRDAAVHLAEQAHLPDDLGAVDLEAATVVVQAHVGDGGDQAVGDPRRDPAQRSIQPVATPALEQIQIAREGLVDEPRDVPWVVSATRRRGSR